MYSIILTKLMITMKITSWERDNHIATCISLSPGGDYSRMAMVSRSLMERCSPEGRWRSAAAAAREAAATALGGSVGSHWRGGDGGPWPPFKLGDDAGMEEVLWP